MRSICTFLLVWVSYLISFSIFLNPGIGAVLTSAVFSLTFTVVFALVAGAWSFDNKQAFLAASAALLCVSLFMMLLPASSQFNASISGRPTWVSGRPTSLAFVHEAIFFFFV